MAKRQKLSSYQLNDLPDEVILKLFSFMDIKELLLCGQVSERFRAIANDESLWLKLNLCVREVPYEFIEKAAENGCKYLSLVNCDILGLTGKSESSFNFKYLNMSLGYEGQGLSKVLQNCISLQKLSLACMPLDLNDVQDVCRNGQTLQVLDLESSRIDLPNQTKALQDLFTNCSHLTELNICALNCSLHGSTPLHIEGIQALVDNLTPTILKLNFNDHRLLNDKHVKKLVERCNKITHLGLRGTQITNDSVKSIITHLNTSLEKLDVSETKVDSVELLELKSISTLKTLIYSNDGGNDSKNLKKRLPHISINEEQDLHIAKPFKIKSIHYKRHAF